MHLTECITLYTESTKFDYQVRSCVNEWLFKSTTEFYGWDDRLHLNDSFGFLCWSYTFAGLMMLLLKPSWSTRSSFPYTFFALILIFVQGVFFT